MKYILDNKEPVLIEEGNTEALIEWAKWFKASDRTVKATKLNNEITVSTVFLALDHNHFGGEPLLFETRVFRNGSGCEMDRCSTWQGAEKMHDKMVEQVKAELGV